MMAYGRHSYGKREPREDPARFRLIKLTLDSVDGNPIYPHTVTMQWWQWMSMGRCGIKGCVPCGTRDHLPCNPQYTEDGRRVAITHRLRYTEAEPSI
jgi:hypothetical protein